ncbi:MAG: hypothetical protein WAO71_07905 [Gallionella sp.]
MNEITKIQPRKLKKLLCCALGLMGVMSGGDAKCYDTRPDPMVPIVLAQAATPATTAPLADYLLKTCMESSSGGTHWITPGGELLGALQNRSREVFNLYESAAREAAVKVTLMAAPAHGKLILQPQYKGYVVYQYQAEPGYVGKDKVVFMAEFNGKRYKIVYNLIVSKDMDERNPLCPPNTTLIKLQNKPASGSSGYDLNSTSVTFAALDGGAIGLTNINGITLDTNAAGYNWFIDNTPSPPTPPCSTPTQAHSCSTITAA